jgi:plasmid stabilization system protein ParE
MPSVVLLAGAQNESLDIFARIEARDPEAADAFYARLDGCLDQLAAHPQSAPVFHGAIRRMVIRGYPFGIFFTVEGERICVQAILDLRQEPDQIRRRIGLES